MAEEKEKLEEQVKTLRKEMDDMLRQRAEVGPLVELAERVAAMEDSRQDAFAWGASTPDTSRSGDLMDVRKMPTAKEDKFEIIPFDIEFGKPTANVTTDVATVTLQPCDQAGTSFANASTAAVYVSTDRAIQGIGSKGWTTATVLSFVRFSPYVSGTPNIEGVLIGGWSDGPVGGVIIWALGVANIPAGWALADGQVHDGVTTIDMRDVFPVGYDAGGTPFADYATPGATGGFDLHGGDTNSHTDHDLEFETSNKQVKLGTDDDACPDDPTITWTGDALRKPDANHDAPHGGSMAANGDALGSPSNAGYTDNRPSYAVVVWIQKIA